MADDWRKLLELAVEDALAGFPFACIPKRLARVRCDRCQYLLVFDLDRRSVRCMECGLWLSVLQLRSRRYGSQVVGLSDEEYRQFERDVVAAALEQRAADLRRGSDVRLIDRAAAGLFEEASKVKGSADDG